MHAAKSITYDQSDKDALYRHLLDDLRALLADERDWLVNTANAAALLFHTLPALNWAGFYFYREEQLVLGPFQGKPACMRIAMGKGVCGTAAKERRTIVVPNVHEFPGHIACDDASQSEIVVPMILDERLIGVLDLDSPIVSRFGGKDAQALESFANVLLTATDWRFLLKESYVE
jgi:L-methionine (R)-S-oxide reductase